MTRARRPRRGSGRRDVVQLLFPFLPSFVEGFDDLVGGKTAGLAVLVHVPEALFEAGPADVVTVTQLANGGGGPTRLHGGNRDDPVEPIGHGAAFGFQARLFPFDDLRQRWANPGWLPPRGGFVVCVFRHVLMRIGAV